MRYRILLSILLTTSMLAAGCASTKTLDGGPAKAKEQVAVVQTQHGQFKITRINSIPVDDGPNFQVPPGKTTILVRYNTTGVGAPYYQMWENAGAQLAEFNAEAGHSYYAIRGIYNTSGETQVWDATTKKRVTAKVTRMSKTVE